MFCKLMAQEFSIKFEREEVMLRKSKLTIHRCSCWADRSVVVSSLESVLHDKDSSSLNL